MLIQNYRKKVIGQIHTKNQIYSLLQLKADKNSSYTIDDINNLFFNKTQIDDKLNLKSNWTDILTKDQIFALNLLKADKNNTYTITEVNNALNLKSNLDRYHI